MVEVKSCAKCGGSISSQSIIEGKAKFHEGKLVCSECVGKPQPASPASATHDDGPIVIQMDDEPSVTEAVSLPAAPAGEPEGSEQIHVFAGGNANRREAQTFTRQPAVTGKGAIRVRTFDTKLSRGAMDMLDEQINAWLEESGYEVKFVTTTIGDVQGKKTEPHLIINIWY